MSLIFTACDLNDSALNVPAGGRLAAKKSGWKIPSMPVSVDVLDLKFSVTMNQNPSQRVTSKVKIKARISQPSRMLCAGDECC